MLEVSVVDYVLTNVLSFFAGVFLGLGVCACHKDRFLQRERSHEDLSTYNHQRIMPPIETIMATAPQINTIK